MFLHVVHLAFYMFGGPVNRDEEIEYQFVEQPKNKNVKRNLRIAVMVAKLTDNPVQGVMVALFLGFL
ncbi:hypothetical protein MKQ70_27415 [Chitinophaga sedimenti]|uniref:hypothetical protein n=1 Tax=Chitinophaga sedimenti TaxID=2033606 RepID=UPI0020064EEB|nr:hypothetical protein [Chitinophaga sedimenti]MCK7558521.1 hypothetical protein [Chitinophaga sedimenti]